MTVTNRKYKDRLFSFIFGNEENKAWTLSLYNAVNGSDYTDPDLIRINTIREVIYLGMHNDVSFLIGDEMDLYEQQSTYNPNIPVRMLQYSGSLYEKYMTGNGWNKFGRQLIPLPVPKLVVFYNGNEDRPDETILKLSDSFPEGSEGDIEVTVRMLNINHGRNRRLLEACEPLREYAWLISRIREQRSQDIDLETAVDRTISEMPESCQLKPFLKAHKAEVKGMLLTEYNETEAMELFRKDGIREGRAEGRTEGRIEGRAEGQNSLLRLLVLMDKAGEPVDVVKLSTDKEELERLYRKYGINTEESMDTES